MEKISAVIITYNEEKKIGDCLQSLQGIADEIVVVDSNSTDKTAQIVKSFGGRFLRHSFEGYIEQKNFALTRAEYNFVLSLDADEILSEPLRESILKVKEKPEFDGYYMNRMTFLEGKPIKCCGWYPDTKLRLFRRDKGRFTGLNPHDEFRFTKKTEIGKLKGDLLHYSFDSWEALLKQNDKFARISAQSYFNNRRKLSPFYIWVNPLVRFFRDYFLKGGLKAGKTGLLISKANAQATFLKYKYIKEIKKKK